MINLKNDIWFMKLALEEANKAYKLGEVPVGAIFVNDKGDVVSKTHNLKEHTKIAVDHAEVLGIQACCKHDHSWRLEGYTVYVTLEPCPMCLFALMQARVKKVVFGAYDAKGGAISLGYELHKDKRFNHTFQLIGGVEHFECSKLLSDFFRQRRSEYKSTKN